MNLAVNIRNAFKVVEKTHASVGKLLNGLKGNYDVERYVLQGDKFMRWNSDVDPGGWCYQTFQLAFQRLEDGKCLKNGFINAPIYIVEINFWQFDTPKIVVAKMDFGDLTSWKDSYRGPANYGRYAGPLHLAKDGFVKVDLRDEFYKITVPQQLEEKIANKYDGFKYALVTTLELVDINGENYQTEIFGTIEKLHAWEG